MGVVEIPSISVSQLLGVSEKQLYKNFNRYKSRLEESNIIFEGKGRNRKFYESHDIDITKEEIAYNMFKEIAYNVWGFDRQTNIDKLLHYMGLILSQQRSKRDTSVLSAKTIAKEIQVNENTISKYRKILEKNKVFKPKDLSKMVTYISTEDRVFNTYESRLIPNKGNTEYSFKYNTKIGSGNPIYQVGEEKILVDNELMELYNNLAKQIANTPNLSRYSDYKRVKDMVENKKDKLEVNGIHRRIAFDYFRRELGITKLWSVYKTEYEHAFMKEQIILDIITNAFNYKFKDIKKISRRLKEYNITFLDNNYIEVT